MNVKDLICTVLFAPGLGVALAISWVFNKLKIRINPSGNESGMIYFLLVAIISNFVLYASAIAFIAWMLLK